MKMRSSALLMAAVLSPFGYSLTFSTNLVVTSVTNIATFDNVATYTDLTSYSEDGMYVTVPQYAFEEFDPSMGSGTNTFSGHFHYPSGGAYGATHISMVSGGSFNAIDMSAGTGFYGTGPVTEFAYWAYNGATLIGSGTASLVSGGQIGFTDAGGITDLWMGSYQSAADAASANLNSYQALAIDTVRIGTVPEPGTLAVLGLGALALIRRKARK